MMKLRNKFLATALLSAAFAAPAALAQDQGYITYQQPHPSGTPDKVEVLEFFSYTCGHCALIDPLISEWKQTLSDEVELVYVPVAFNASMQPTQKFYYAIEALDRLDLHSKVFDAIHKEKQRLFTEDALIDWAAKQGVDKQQITDAMSSFGVNSKARNARQITDSYRIEGTPSIAVGGRYMTSPSMTGTYEGAINQAQVLLDQILAEN
ncbi:MAG: thiol:disulfide interchange protein DsbA/DsbL [Alcaligenaceae bacterium]|jgi:thiol:disulfide interchange protein DsbA|nr:thiol:disulfide interchange protein DsbA/DsbL [Alcaligenaceae bacterium]